MEKTIAFFRKKRVRCDFKPHVLQGMTVLCIKYTTLSIKDLTCLVESKKISDVEDVRTECGGSRFEDRPLPNLSLLLSRNFLVHLFSSLPYSSRDFLARTDKHPFFSDVMNGIDAGLWVPFAKNRCLRRHLRTPSHSWRRDSCQGKETSKNFHCSNQTTGN